MREIKKLIFKELNTVDIVLKNLLADEQNEVFKYLHDFLNSSSKKIRSILAILYLKSLNNDLSDDVINILCIGELIHNASLLHDDVLDDAETRRERLTCGKKFSPKISILCGDFLLALATNKLIQLRNFDILTIFQNCIQKMCEAEIKQYALRGQKPSIDTYLMICEGKTAALFESILESCAIMCKEDNMSAKTFAKDFGILFQLKNDVEKFSAQAYERNKIYTAKDILGIEKTHCLTDNYLERAHVFIKTLPDNIYTKALEDLLNKL